MPLRHPTSIAIENKVRSIEHLSKKEILDIAKEMLYDIEFYKAQIEIMSFEAQKLRANLSIGKTN